MMFMMFVTMFMIMVLFLISGFYLWFTYYDKSIINQLFDLFSFELSCFWLRAAWTYTWWRWSFRLIWFFVLVLWLKAWFLGVFSILITISVITTASSSLAIASISSFISTSVLSLFSFFSCWFSFNFLFALLFLLLLWRFLFVGIFVCLCLNWSRSRSRCSCIICLFSSWFFRFGLLTLYRWWSFSNRLIVNWNYYLWS